MGYGLPVIYDACVLYSAYPRDILIQMATLDLFRAKWTQQIQDEWASNLIKNSSKVNAQKVQRLCELMNRAVPDAFVTGFESMVESLSLPDPDDRHVLAAAIAANADSIVTLNVKDFPKSVLRSYDIEPQSPDEFISSWINREPDQMIATLEAIRSRYKCPSVDFDGYMEILLKQGLTISVDTVRQNLVAN